MEFKVVEKVMGNGDKFFYPMYRKGGLLSIWRMVRVFIYAHKTREGGYYTMEGAMKAIERFRDYDTKKAEYQRAENLRMTLVSTTTHIIS